MKERVRLLAGDPPGGEIYANVMATVGEDSRRTGVRFTSVSPELKLWIRKVTAQRTPAAAGS